MKRKLKTIQSNLFFTYSLIIIIVLAIFVSFFYVWVSNVLKSRAYDSIDSLSDSFVEKLDTELRKMDEVSMNILYSNLVLERFKKYAAYGAGQGGTSEQDRLNAINNSKELVDMLTAINGPSRPVQQIYLYDFNNTRFGTGFDNRQQYYASSEQPWYDEVIGKGGRKVLSLPQKDPELSRTISAKTDIYYLSLFRLYFDKNNVPLGIVEVKQYGSTIFGSLNEYIGKSANLERIFVYDASGRLIYPYQDQPREDTLFYFKNYDENAQSRSFHSVRNPATGEKELLLYKRSEYSNWVIAVAASEKTLLSPVVTFTKLVVLVAFAILILALLFSFIAARKYTTPIARLRKLIRSMDLQEPSAAVVPDLNSGLNELEELNQAFHKMNIKIKNSLDELLLSQQQEMQSRMLALQSQMNPHFLYNTLTTINVMAEENMNGQIMEMCSNVSAMLRYISSSSSQLVSVQTEMEYTEKYVSILKLRYGAKLNYSTNMDDAVLEVNIPKLIIQPLVENALKHGTRGQPPWDIRVLGYVSSGNWQIYVMDNGPGFDEEALQQLNEKIGEIDKSGLLPSLELDGMGLLNIYLRLKLTYKNQMLFSVSENPDGGTVVAVGGSI